MKDSSCLINSLEWDSNFFGLEVGEIAFSANEDIDLKAIHSEALQRKFDLIYLRTLIEIQSEENKIDLQLVDRKLTYTLDITNAKTKSTSPCIQISPKSDSPHPDLIALSILAGNHSRFKLDKRIEYQKFVDLYTLWIKNSVNRKFADEVFVYQEAGKTLGMITLKVNEDLADIGLISVNENVQGKGVGRKLTEVVINSLKAKNSVLRLNVVTQSDNISACSFYEKIGFEASKKEFIYHMRT